MRARPLAERFWEKVRVIEDADSCWEWTGHKQRHPKKQTRTYGMIWNNGKVDYTNRVAWELQYGPVPEGKHVLHRCDNPACVRGSHLFVGTQRENVLDMNAKGRRNDLRGEVHGMAKLSNAQRLAIRARLGAEGWKALAREHKVSKATIYRVAQCG